MSTDVLLGGQGHLGRSPEGEESQKGSFTDIDFTFSMSGLPTLFQVMDKLAKINKLKEEAAGGKQLEKNQLEMISKEQELAEELKMLQL